MLERIYRCSDGHLYSAQALKASLLSVHLGIGAHLQRCPVDNRWRVARAVDPNQLTNEELARARAHSM
jgi:hypothetical protein